MKRNQQRDRTRRAILDALATVIVESTGLGFSVQDVARAAGVTHRTVYNHFPTREALLNDFAVYVEERLAALGPPPDKEASLDELGPMAGEAYAFFDLLEKYVRANVILMVASRGPATVTRERTAAFEALVARDARLRPSLAPRQVAAAVRMFLSSTGWHLLTEHLGLSPEEAATTATWAAQALLDAATCHEPPTGGTR